METLCDVLGLGSQWADFARRTWCMMMFGRPFSQNGDMGRASRCRGIDMLYGGLTTRSDAWTTYSR